MPSPDPVKTSDGAALHQRSRVERLLPDVPVGAKLAAMLGVAGGLFASIVASYRWPEYGLVSLGSGIAAGFVAAIAVSYRHSRKSVEPTDGNLVGEKPDCAGIDSAM